MGFSTVVGILFYVLWLLWTASANVAFIMMEMMVSVEGGRLILPRNRVLGEPAAAIAPARTPAASWGRAPRNTIWVDDDRDFYGEIRRGACAMLDGSALCWGRLW